MRYLFHNFINTLRHYKASSLLNIIGMAVAFAAFYLILTQVRWGLGYNQKLEDGDRIFLMVITSSEALDKQNAYFCRPIAEQLLSSASGVESYGTATFYTGGGTFFYIKDGDHVRKVRTTEQQFSAGAISLFGFEAEQGKLEELSNPNTVAISSKFARENDLHVGDKLSKSSTGEPVYAEIVAIWKDKFQPNSSPGSIDLLSDIADYSLDNRGEWSYPYFVKLNSPDGVEAFEQSTKKVMRSYLESLSYEPEEVEQGVEENKISLIPLKDVYYRNDLYHVRSVCSTGSRSTDLTLLAVAALIIIIALINFINFFFALVPARVKSVNTYKVFGTPRSTLIFNFIMESVGLVGLALLLAVVITVSFAKSSGQEVLSAPIDAASNASIVQLTIAIALLGAVLSSIYPALYITSFQPAMVLKGSFSSSAAGRNLRNVLIGVQFSISMALIICASFVKLQHSYMMNFDMGFDRQYLLTGNLPTSVSWWGERNAAFEDKLRSNPDIVDLTWADGQIINVSRMGWGRPYKDKQIDFQCYPVAYNFLDVMGVEMAEGRSFSKSDEQAEHGVMIFNEQARDQYGIVMDASGPGHSDNNAEVVGFCKNFHFRPLQYDSYPFAFYMFGKDHTWRSALRHIYVRTAAGANPGKVMNFIKNTALEISPDTDPDTINIQLFDEELARQYQSEERLSRQISLFTFVAIVLSLMGVFGLVFFETQHRKKEIALRRVLGASVESILLMFCKKYSLIVLICFVIAAPLSWIFIHRYFSNFAYHTTISWWVFALALFIVLAITVVIVVVRSISAANSNPVDSIKTE